MKITLKSLVLTFVLVTGCATLSIEGAKVMIVDPSQVSELKDCKPLEKLEVTISKMEGQNAMIIWLKNRTAKLGANVLVSKLAYEDVGSGNFRGQGKPFICDPSVLKSLHSTEEY